MHLSHCLRRAAIVRGLTEDTLLVRAAIPFFLGVVDCLSVVRWPVHARVNTAITMDGANGENAGAVFCHALHPCRLG